MKMKDRLSNLLRKEIHENPPFPKSVKIEITSHCNYKCSCCFHKDSLGNKGFIDPNFLKYILFELKSLNVEEVGLFGLGESTLDKNLPLYIKMAKDLGIPYVFLTTNGSLCTLDYIKTLLDSGLDSLKFSINAYDRDSYLKETKRDNFIEVVGNLKRISKYIKEKNIKCNLSVSCIFYPDKEEEYLKFKSEIEKFAEFYFLPLYNQAGLVPDEKASKGNIGALFNNVSPMPCYKIFNFANITWDGYLTACCFDFQEKFKIADLKKVSLIEAWNNQKFKDLRTCHLKGIVPDLCKDCLCQS